MLLLHFISFTRFYQTFCENHETKINFRTLKHKNSETKKLTLYQSFFSCIEGTSIDAIVVLQPVQFIYLLYKWC